MSTSGGLAADIRLRRGEFDLDLALTADAGEVVALLGPNGAGKTSALRALAGLTPLAAGRVSLDGTPIEEPATGLRLPAQARPVSMVFQDYLLFPHLSALDNVAFGPRCRRGPDGGRVSRRAAREQAATWLERVGLADRAELKPAALSGGQAQRVALARALAAQPSLLLLDEPLAALDAHTRLEVRGVLREHLAAFAGVSVLVTHDLLDAMVLADRVVVIERGRATQQGAPADIARQPRTEYVARLAGLNLHQGSADGKSVTLAEGVVLTAAVSGAGPVHVAFRPSAVTLSPQRPPAEGNQWAARIDGVEPRGDTVRVRLAGALAAHADISPANAAGLDLRLGAPVWASLAPADVDAYPT
jgi:molybdate transport system ATP-binding protein